MIAICEFCNTLNNFEKTGPNCTSCGAPVKFELDTTTQLEMEFAPMTTGAPNQRADDAPGPAERAKRRWWER